jgi:hypothetical protein
MLGSTPRSRKSLTTSIRLLLTAIWSGVAPLHWAAENGHIHIIELLLGAGADINAKNKDGNTPLHYAALTCKVETVELLLKRGADPTAKNVKGETPADVAKNRYEMHKKLCKSPYSYCVWRKEIEKCETSLKILEKAKQKNQT